jgi:nucleotide-binding universal stress UspA family protein
MPGPSSLSDADRQADNHYMTMKIIVGVDGSEPSFEALRWAVHEARRHDAEMTVVSCYSVPAYGGFGGAIYPSSVDVETMKDAAATVVDKVRRTIKGR